MENKLFNNNSRKRKIKYNKKYRYTKKVSKTTKMNGAGLF